MASPRTESDALFTLPNALTLVRLGLIVPFARFAMAGDDRAALAVFLLAGFTDLFDGALARRLGQASKWGRLIDPVADKLLTGTAYVVLAAFRSSLPSIPLWVMWAVLIRDLFILGGSAVIYSARGKSSFRPSVWGKLNTFIEIGVVVWFLSGLLGFALPALYVLLLLSLLISGADYVRAGLRMSRP